MQKRAHIRTILLDCRIHYVKFMRNHEQTGIIMLTEQRRRLILDVLTRDGRAVAAELARLWEVSEDTIRRDMRDMASAGLLNACMAGRFPSLPPCPTFPRGA